jgi:hypothetical protein
VIPDLAHAAAGLQYCLAKDRAFVDPLKPSSSGVSASSDDTSKQVSTTGTSTIDSSDTRDSVEEGAGVLGEIVFEDDAMSSSSSSSSSDVDDDSENDVGLNPLSESAPVIASESVQPASADSMTSIDGEASVSKGQEHVMAGKAAPPVAVASGSAHRAPVPPKSSSRLQLPHDRPVILLPNGLVVYNKISFSLAMHHAVVRGTYSEDAGHVQLICKGLVMEAIWPKISNVSRSLF